MDRLAKRNWRAGRSAVRGVAWFAGALASAAAVAVGVVLAVVFAATFVVIGLMASALLALMIAAFKARRTVRAPVDADIIEARNIGGHSWIAYGWDGRR
jgi:hypothetical protein